MIHIHLFILVEIYLWTGLLYPALGYFAAKLICWFQTPTIVLIFLLLYLYSNQHWVHADTCYGLWEGGLYPYTEQCLIMRACHSKYRMRNELELVFESNRRKISIMHEFLSWIPV